MSKSNDAMVRYDRGDAVRVMLEGLTNGLSLRTICMDQRMPSPSTIYEWLTADPSLSEKYAHAREADGQLTGEEIAEIARKVLRGEIDPQAARVAIDGLKWVAARKSPRVYGDRLRVDAEVGSVVIAAFADMARPAEPKLIDASRDEAPARLPHVTAPDQLSET